MTDDDRVTCTTCQHYRGGNCHQAHRAIKGIKHRIEQIGRDLAELPQRCPAHKPRDNHHAEQNPR